MRKAGRSHRKATRIWRQQTAASSRKNTTAGAPAKRRQSGRREASPIEKQAGFPGTLSPALPRSPRFRAPREAAANRPSRPGRLELSCGLSPCAAIQAAQAHRPRVRPPATSHDNKAAPCSTSRRTGDASCRIAFETGRTPGQARFSHAVTSSARRTAAALRP